MRTWRLAGSMREPSFFSFAPMESFTAVSRTQVLTEEGHHMVLEADSHGAGMSSRINLERMGDAVVVEDAVQLSGVDPQSILVAYVDRNCPILLQVADVLIDKRERCIRRPPG